MLLSAGDLIAIAVAVLSSATTVTAVLIAQRREDRRTRQAEEWRRATERHRRLQAESERVLTGVKWFQATTSPFDWQPDRDLSEDELRRRRERIDKVFNDLATAWVNLTLEGVAEQVKSIDKMVGAFVEFQTRMNRVSRTDERGSAEDYTGMDEASKRIRTLAEELERELPKLLAETLPARVVE